MKRWIRIGTVALATATAVALGLSSASALPGRPAAAPPSLVTGQTAQQADVQTDRPAKSETLFYPVTPCRIVDTRAAGGILANNTARTFYVTGTFGFAPQGGRSGGCSIPAAATGVTTNVTSVGTVADGFLTGYPTGGAAPLSNFTTTHRNFTLTVNPTFALAAGAAKPLTIADHGGNTHLIIDVTGYYIPQLAGLFFIGNTAPARSTSRMLSLSRVGAGVYTVTVDSDITSCTPIASPGGSVGLYASAYVVATNQVRVSMWTLNTSGQPVPSDGGGFFNLTITC